MHFVVCLFFSKSFFSFERFFQAYHQSVKLFAFAKVISKVGKHMDKNGKLSCVKIGHAIANVVLAASLIYNMLRLFVVSQ